MNTSTKKLINFINESPTAFHAVTNIAKELSSNNYIELFENQAWELEKGNKYFVKRNDSSIIAFVVPEKKPNGFMICASHSDSPMFKIKHSPEIASDNYVRINTERYGGMIYSSWLDKPLSVAGRIICKSKDGIKTNIVNIDEDLLLIPNVAIHMNRKINDEYSYNPATDLVPLYTSEKGKDTFISEIAKKTSIDANSIIDFDLFLYNRQKGTIWGNSEEYFSAPRIDNLQCAFSSIEALLKTNSPKAFPIAAIFDNEEVGSLSKQGADSTFLYDILNRICVSLYNNDNDSLQQMIASSMMLSADNAHAVHPNHPEYADPTHKPYMNKGIVIKYNANQKYTTDSISSSLFQMICEKANVPVQFFANRSDMAGGSTLGNISNAHISITTVDIGCPQLSMHSSFETAGTKDTDYMINAIKEFYSTSVYINDGNYTLN